MQYNKVTNDAFKNLIKEHSKQHTFKTINLQMLDRSIDVADFNIINRLLTPMQPFNAILVGDIFWPTGQNICKWCKINKVFCGFIQHGQWIYTANKINPKYLPSATFVYGQNIKDEIESWPYGKKSSVVATGNPRYDNVETNLDGKYIYVAPPVMHEVIPSSSDRINAQAKRLLESLSKSGARLMKNLLIHPHYREGNTKYLEKLFPIAKHVDKKENPFKYIKNASSVLTHRNSTTVLDAIAHKKQTILMNFDDYPSYFPIFYFADFAIESERPQECIEFLKHKFDPIANYEEKAKEFIVLGNASKRILDYISNKV